MAPKAKARAKAKAQAPSGGSAGPDSGIITSGNPVHPSEPTSSGTAASAGSGSSATIAIISDALVGSDSSGGAGLPDGSGDSGGSPSTGAHDSPSPVAATSASASVPVGSGSTNGSGYLVGSGAPATLVAVSGSTEGSGSPGGSGSRAPLVVLSGSPRRSGSPGASGSSGGPGTLTVPRGARDPTCGASRTELIMDARSPVGDRFLTTPEGRCIACVAAGFLGMPTAHPPASAIAAASMAAAVPTPAGPGGEATVTAPLAGGGESHGPCILFAPSFRPSGALATPVCELNPVTRDFYQWISKKRLTNPLWENVARLTLPLDQVNRATTMWSGTTIDNLRFDCPPGTPVEEIQARRARWRTLGLDLMTLFSKYYGEQAFRSKQPLELMVSPTMTAVEAAIGQIVNAYSLCDTTQLVTEEATSYTRPTWWGACYDTLTYGPHRLQAWNQIATAAARKIAMAQKDFFMFKSRAYFDQQAGAKGKGFQSNSNGKGGSKGNTWAASNGSGKGGGWVPSTGNGKTGGWSDTSKNQYKGKGNGWAQGAGAGKSFAGQSNGGGSGNDKGNDGGTG